jgi:hypothetical protein
MAVYTVLSVDVLPECVAGRHHVVKASLMVDSSAGGVVPIARLQSMAESGDTFVVAADGAADAEHVAAFVPCACGTGYILQSDGLVDEYPARG